MIVWKKIFDLIKARALNSKKIRIDEKELDKNIKIILVNLILFNTLNDFDTTVYENFMSLKDVLILNEFVPFVIPTSVRYFSGDQKSSDLLVRWSVKDALKIFELKDDIVNYNSFLNAQIYFRGIFKDNISSNVISLDSLKVTKSLSDVINIAAFVVETKDNEGKNKVEILVKYENEPFVPVILNSNAFSLFRDDYVNAEYDVIITDYFNRVRYS